VSESNPTANEVQMLASVRANGICFAARND